MPTLTYLGDEYSCATAIKGADYIHLLNEAGVMIAAFDEIKDFSGFKLTNGSYTSPAADHDCYLAVLRDDGTIGRGGHKCSDIPQTAADVGAVPTTRKVNNKALSGDISLTAADVGALALDGSNAMTGALGVNNNYGNVNANASRAQLRFNPTPGDTKNASSIGIYNGADGLAGIAKIFAVINGSESSYNILHTGSVPNAGNFIAGSYVGTGTCGAEGKTEITFPFEPKYVIVYEMANWVATAFTFINPLGSICALSGGDIAYNFNSFVEWDNKTMRWYIERSLIGGTEPTAGLQANESGKTYYYAAWG